MEQWEQFEEKCTKYLNDTYATKTIKFESTGGYDSTKSDILCLSNNKELFFIECKMKNAQSGQFVLLNKGNGFIFSPQNKSPQDLFSELIIRYINEHYDTFKNVSSKALLINLPESLYSSWIIEHYKQRNVKYIITQDSNEHYIIFPVEKLQSYFNITANFRIKKSGSRNLSAKCIPELQSLLSDYTNVSDVYSCNEEYYITSDDKNIPSKIAGEKYTYQLNERPNNAYLIRLLSNTANPNVIFSIELKSSQNINDLEVFKKNIED